MKASIITLLALSTAAQAATISLNFTDNDSADSTMSAGDIAGAPSVTGARVDDWNNITVNGASGGPAAGLNDDSGTAVAASVSYTTDFANWRLNHAVANGDDRMWKGYIDIATSGSVTVSNLTYGTYDVVVYFDGSNGTEWRKAGYTIGADFQDGEDSESTSWGTGQNTNNVYQLPTPGAGGNSIYDNVGTNNDEGNYLVFTGVTGSSFTVNAAGTGGTTSTRRAPINGIQIIETVPEPSSALLLTMGSIVLFRRKRS